MTQEIVAPRINATIADLVARAAEKLRPGSLEDFHRECAEAAREIDAARDRKASNA